MRPNEIPTSVRQLIVRHISSAQQVEILTLLERDRRRWTAPEVCRSLHISPEACGAWLERFAAAGLVARPEDRVYQHSDGKQARLVTELVDLYTRRRTSVVDTIYNRSE